jgi:phosphoglycerate dehydrogenase-like enzyme
MSSPRAIIALTDAEIEDFFPGRLWENLQLLLSRPNRLSMPPAHPEDWNRLWRETPPDILVSGWKTLPLQPDLRVGHPGGLRYLCHTAGTVRKLVPRELIARGLLVTNWGSSISATVAEATLMLILMCLRRSSYWSITMHREGGWKNGDTITHSLLGRRVGIHGFGAISQALVSMLRPFTQKIQAFSPHVPDKLFADAGMARVHNLEELFSTSDVVVELAAAIPENHHIVTEALLRKIPEGGVFVNLGRGELVDETALIRVAREGRLQIGLDVFETEPLPVDSPLRGLPNVTLLPHLGGPTRDRRRDLGALAIKNLDAYLHGKPMEAIVNLEVYDRST